MTSSGKETDTAVESEFLYSLNKFRQTNFFAAISPEAVKLIAFLCTREVYKPGEALFNQNDDDGCAYYITAGSAGLVLETRSGRQTVKTLGKDSFIGALSLVTVMPRKFSLIAETETECLVMTRKKFSKVLDQFPEIALKLIAGLGEKLTEAEKNWIGSMEALGKAGAQLAGISLL